MTLFWPSMTTFNEALSLEGVLQSPCLVIGAHRESHTPTGMEFHRDFFHRELKNALQARQVGRVDDEPSLPEYATVFDLDGIESEDLIPRSESFWHLVRPGGMLVIMTVSGGTEIRQGSSIDTRRMIEALRKHGLELKWSAFHDQRHDPCLWDDIREVVLGWFVARKKEEK